MAAAHWIDALDRKLNDASEPQWQRPSPTPIQLRNDIVGSACFILAALLVNAVTLSIGPDFVSDNDQPAWRSYMAVALMIAPLAFRRRAALTTVLASSILFISLSYFAPEATPQIPFQVAYFASLYTAVAWARDRRALWFAMGLVLLTMMLWVGILATQLHAQDTLQATSDSNTHGPFPKTVSMAGYMVITNLAYFGGAILIGRTSWRGALQRYRSERQAILIAEQADDLANNAVLDERMRIARELHDVVAHHVSTIGIQAAAARTVLATDPQSCADALQEVERSSRHAVTDMRNLLGVLRSDTDLHHQSNATDRSPEPGLGQLDELITDYRESGHNIVLSQVEYHPGDLAQISPPLGLSAFRIIQESLANVRRHSTAGKVQVVVRTGATAPNQESQWLEIEVVDNGRRRAGTSGSGYGLRGIRERATLHGGTYDAGPRSTEDGWRVRVRLPLQDNE